MGAREVKALEVLHAGGRYVKALRPAYHGGEKFKHWLVDSAGYAVPGYGVTTFHKLLDAGVLGKDHGVLYGSTCREEFFAAHGPLPAKL